MRSGRYWRLFLHGACCGVAFVLLAFVFGTGQSPAIPTTHASGVPYCPNPLMEEHAPTRPAPHLDRTEGPVGTQLTFIATGWRPGARVTLHFDGRDPKTGKLHVLIPTFARGAVASDGTVTLSSLQAPSFLCMDMYSNPTIQYLYGDAAGGETSYFVLTSDDGAVSAPVSFHYLPAPTVRLGGLDTYGSAKVGASIVVSGAGWEPREPLTLTLVDEQRRAPIPFATTIHIGADAAGAFATTYPLDARLPWNSDAELAMEGRGPRFGTLAEYAHLSLLPAIQPTLRVDQQVVTPGMAITVSGAHWYPGATYTIKYCGAQWWKGGWVEGGNCGKAANPALGNVTADAQGRLSQRFTIPADEPLGVIVIRIDGLYGWIGVPEITVHVVDHLPTWDDIHPRVAGLRDKVVGLLPFTLPTAALLGALGFVGVRRWRGHRMAH